jgi:omega-6 fatty acid desaturase (delta-12 desaturase)
MTTDTPAHSLATPLAEYRQPSLNSSLWQLGSTLAAFCGTWWLMWWVYPHSYLATLALAAPCAALLVRLFILQHDCGHGSFFASKRANDIVGSLLGVLTMTPHYRWRKTHAIHHATNGDLDRRGNGDVLMLTVREYLALSPIRRFVYRVNRHPLVLFGIAPFFYFTVWQRFVYEPRAWRKERASVLWTDLAILVCGLVLWRVVGLERLLLIHLPVVALASSAGVWLFYVQHQFDPSYWERHDQWDYFAAGIEGSSYYQLPRPLQWVTASIGLHHIHHIDSQIPNYRLQECLDQHPELQNVQHLTLWESLSCAALKLWDEDQSRMVGFPRRD